MYRKQQNERKKNVSNTTGTLVLEVPQTTGFSNEVSGILDSFDLKCHKEALDAGFCGNANITFFFQSQ